jgi:hypothetical protein
MTDGPTPGQSDAKRGGRAWLSRDILLVIIGAVLALATEEWRDARHRRVQMETALTSIRDELKANVLLVTRARERHAFLADTLTKLVAAGRKPDVQIYSNGMANPASVSNTAWQLARQSGALSDVPLSVLLAIAPAYDAQDRYRSVGDALAAELMLDARRNGMDVVLRDRFAQFIPMDIEFGNRETVLLEKYQSALDQLELSVAGKVRSLPPRAGRDTITASRQ